MAAIRLGELRVGRSEAVVTEKRGVTGRLGKGNQSGRMKFSVLDVRGGSPSVEAVLLDVHAMHCARASSMSHAAPRTIGFFEGEPGPAAVEASAPAPSAAA